MGAVRSLAARVPLAPRLPRPADATRPVVVNPLTDSPFSPWDQYEMAYWNRYSGDLFRVSAAPTPNWAYGNGVSDIVGFLDDGP